MSTDKNKNDPRTEKPIEIRERKRLDESLANRDNSVERPVTKFEAPEPWPDPKDDKKKEDKG